MKAKILATASALAIGLTVAGAASAQATANGAGNDNATVTNSYNRSYSDLLDVILTDNAADNNSSQNGDDGSYNGATSIAATQVLYAVNTNSEMDELVDLDGEDESETPVGYNSGNNSVNDNAFAAFAGINNLAWNSGINANTQAGTNIAAQGTVTFGVGAASEGDDGAGGGGGGED